MKAEIKIKRVKRMRAVDDNGGSTVHRIWDPPFYVISGKRRKILLKHSESLTSSCLNDPKSDNLIMQE